jgi:hypothetical protein
VRSSGGEFAGRGVTADNGISGGGSDVEAGGCGTKFSGVMI